MRAIGLADVEDAPDVGMIERSDGAGLALEAGPGSGIARDHTRQHLDCDRPIEARVAGSINLTHPAHAKQGADFVGTEAGALSEGQRWRDYKGRAAGRTGLLCDAEVATEPAPWGSSTPTRLLIADYSSRRHFG